MKHLIEKRADLIAQYDAMKAVLTTEKRSAFTSEEFEKINNIKIEIENLEKQIGTEKDFEVKRNFKLDSIGGSETRTKGKNLLDEFRSFATSANNGEKFTVPFSAFEQRAAITTSSNSHFGYTDSAPYLSIAQSELILDKIGVKTWYFDSGSQDFPSITQIVAAGPGTEDSANSDSTLTSAKITLAPGFYSASLEISKKFLATSKPENIAALIAELQLAVKKEVQKDTVDSMNSLATIAASGVTMHSGTTVMEKSLVGSPTHWILGKDAYQFAQNRKIGTDQSMVLSKEGNILTYPALRNTLQTTATYAYLVDASALAMAYWGEGISFEVVIDSTLARKGSCLLIASCMAAGSYTDSNKVSVSKNFTSWT